MHFVVCWDIRTTGPKKTEIDNALKECIKGYRWVRPLQTFYIVKIEEQSDHDKIREKMVAIGKKYGSHVNFIMSPTMTGQYRGWLPSDLWPKIQERTK